jgi:hypothetical protein
MLKIVSRYNNTKILYQAKDVTFAVLMTAAIKAGADLYGADLRSADLYGADLRSANLRSANLRSADLYGANLYGADLYGAKNSELALAQTSIVPDCGPLFGWKKCRNNVLVRLFIPSRAKRSNASGRKWRRTSEGIGGHRRGVRRLTTRFNLRVPLKPVGQAD